MNIVVGIKGRQGGISHSELMTACLPDKQQHCQVRAGRAYLRLEKEMIIDNFYLINLELLTHAELLLSGSLLPFTYQSSLYFTPLFVLQSCLHKTTQACKQCDKKSKRGE